MTQETLDMIVQAYCDGCQEFIGDYEVEVEHIADKGLSVVGISHPNIEKVSLPFEYIKDGYTPKEKAKIVIELIKQIFENSDKWLDDEKDYDADRAADKWDNDRHSDL